jgi:large subunit ribosomal protein L49
MLKLILKQNTLLKTQSTLNLVRNFQSATTGEVYGKFAQKSEFLTKPTQVSNLPYFVKRTKYLSLPIYSEFKNGRSRTLTVIRRIEGDREALRNDLSSIVPRKDITVDRVTGHLIVKGLKVHEVRDFLTSKGF